MLRKRLCISELLLNYCFFIRAVAFRSIQGKQFHAIGMRGYLGNALSEFGHLLLEFDAESDWPSMPSDQIIEAGVEDVSSTIESCFGQYPFDLGTCSTALRNLFGMIVLISFSKEGSTLAFPTSLRTELLPWAEEDEIWWDKLGSEAVHSLKALLNLEAAIAQFEHDAHHSKNGPIEVASLATACKRLGFFGGHPNRGCNWLIVYLRRRWGLAGHELNKFAAQLADPPLKKWPMPPQSLAPSSQVD